MSARAALARLAAAHPVAAHEVDRLVGRQTRDELLVRVVSGRAGPPPRRSRRSRLRPAVVLVALLATAAAPAYALGRTLVDWLGAEPAPPAVVEDFGRYAPQLGFDPEPGKAVLVAQHDGVRLFATTNRQGTYCFILSTRADGGTCVSTAVAASPVVAGYVSDVEAESGGRVRVVVGRILDPRARAVAFTAPDGRLVAARVGAGGFFVARTHGPADESVCARGDWEPRFAFRGAGGDVVSERTILLARARGLGVARVCSAGFFLPAKGK